MNRTYEEWLKYYKNATKEQVVEDIMLDINNIKEKDKEIERLNNILNELEKYLINVKQFAYLDKLKKLKEGKIK